MDKDLFRQDIGGLKEAYQEVANRLGILPEKKTYSSTKTEIVKQRIKMKVEVNISLKEGVLDPEGQAIDNTLRNLGYNDFDNIRTGKQIILNIDKADEDEVLKQADKMCQELLVNIIIENYQINIIKDK